MNDDIGVLICPGPLLEWPVFRAFAGWVNVIHSLVGRVNVIFFVVFPANATSLPTV